MEKKIFCISKRIIDVKPKNFSSSNKIFSWFNNSKIQKKIQKLLCRSVLAKQTSTAGLGALLHENNHGCRRASAFTYLLLIWIWLFKLRLSVIPKNAFVVVKYVMRVRTSTAFTSKVLSFHVLRRELHFHAYIYLCTCHSLFMLTIYLFG